jgi:hypothetical protein
MNGLDGLNQDCRDIILALANAGAALLRNKRATGRPQDRIDADALEQRQRGQ